jgi:hypothetical protein
MSIIDTATNSVIDYTPTITKPLTGQRLSVVYWKTDKLTGIKKDSKCVSIPKLVASAITVEHKEQLLPFMVDMLVGVQNKIIREMIESGSVHIQNSEIDIASCIQYLENSISNDSDDDGNGNTVSLRLNKEMLNTWFDTVIADKLVLLLAQKLGVDENSEPSKLLLLEKTLKAFKDKIASLAAGTTKLDIKSINSLRNVIALAISPDTKEDGNSVLKGLSSMDEADTLIFGDKIYLKLREKLNKMEKALSDDNDLVDIL